MGDLPYISSEQGDGLIVHVLTELIYEYTLYKCPIELRAEEGSGLIIRTIHYPLIYTKLTLEVCTRRPLFMEKISSRSRHGS